MQLPELAEATLATYFLLAVAVAVSQSAIVAQTIATMRIPSLNHEEPRQGITCRSTTRRYVTARRKEKSIHIARSYAGYEKIQMISTTS